MLTRKFSNTIIFLLVGVVFIFFANFVSIYVDRIINIAPGWNIFWNTNSATRKHNNFISKSVHVSLPRELIRVSNVRAHLEIKLRMYESVAISQLDNVFIRFGVPNTFCPRPRNFCLSFVCFVFWIHFFLCFVSS